ncbi:MAG: pilus assembly protein [Cytophagales bacterium]|nr:pilus assembly protein [Cytophagales bacterium]
MSVRVSAAVIDTGPLYALFDSKDRWHKKTHAWLAQNPKTQLITTWMVLAEVGHLLSQRLHNQAALDFLTWIQRGGVSIDTPEQNLTLDHILATCTRYADLPMDLADASVAEAATRLGVRHILSVDPDLTIFRDAKGRGLNNLLN